MAVVFGLTATIAREIDNNVSSKAPLVVAGSRVLFNMMRATAGAAWEMWRSDDRGVTFAFSVISDFAGAKHSLFLAQSQWWMYDLNNSEFRRTPEANPGAGGFSSTPMNFTAGHDHSNPIANGNVFICQPQVSGLKILGPVAVAGEPPATPQIGNLVDNVNGRGFVRIPGTVGDLLLLTQGPNIRRIQTSPFSQVQNVLLAGTEDGAEHPFPNVSALSATEYWTSTDRDIEPSKSWQSTDGGATYTERNLEANFWADVPGVTAERRKGLMTRFFLFGGSRYCFVKYVDVGGNPAQNGRHAKLAKFDASANVWRVESNRVADGGIIQFAGSGETATGVDMYIVSLDEPGNITRVYRAGLELGVSKIPKRIHGTPWAG